MKTPFPLSSWFQWLLRLALGLFLIAILVRWQGAGMCDALRDASWFSLSLAVVLYLASQSISALKWKILLSAVLAADNSNQRAENAGRSTPLLELSPQTPPQFSSQTPPGWGECYRFYLIGMFCSLWLPTAVGGDAVRATLAGQRWGSFALAASSILVERITGLFALLCIGLGGWIFWTQRTAIASSPGAITPVPQLILGAFSVIGVLLLSLWALRALAYFLESRSDSKFIAQWTKIHRAVDIFASPKLRPALWQAVALSFGFQSAQILLNLFLARAVGLSWPSEVFVWMTPSLSIASMIPLGIGGLGVREGAALALARSTLPASEVALSSLILAWSLLWQATLWISGLPGALAYGIQKEKRAP